VLLFLLIPGGEPRNPLLSVRGEIKTAGAVNRYTFTARNGQEVFLDVQECVGGSLLWTLLAPNDQTFGNEAIVDDLLMCNNLDPDPRQGRDQGVLTLRQAGRYQLIVHGAGDATGTYRVKIQSR